MEITVKKRGEYWMVEFYHGNQFFTLDYRVETKEEAEWMKTMLSKCFTRAFGEGWNENSALPLADVNASFLSYTEKPESYIQKQLLRTLKNIDHFKKYADQTKQIRKADFHQYMRLIKEPLMRAFGVVFPDELPKNGR